MSENNTPLENNSGKKADAELEKLLIQVFGSKENLEKEREKAAQNAERLAETPEISFANQGKEHNGIERKPRPNSEHRRQGAGNGERRRPPEQRPGQGNGQRRPRPDGKQQVPHRKKRPVQNGQRPYPDRRRPDNRLKNTDRRNNPNRKTDGKAKAKNHKKKKKLTGWKKVAVIAGVLIGIILALVLLVYGVYSFYFSLFGKYSGGLNSGKYQYDSSDYVDGPDTLTEEELKKQLEATADDPMKDKDVFNVLLIGEDLRDTETQERGNTDVMMMISLNKKMKTITMTSFLRDTWVDIDGYGMAKLNAAYWRDGPELLKGTLEKYYGVSIDRYVIVNFESFITIVDALGGITLDVTDEEAEGMKEPMAEVNDIYGDKWGTDYLDQGGRLTLNGRQALAYARLRYVGNADYERTERQRRVITEIINESKDLNLLEINSLLTKVLPQIKIDITKEEMNSLLLNCLDYMNYEIQELQMPAMNLFTEEVISNLSVLCPDFQANSQLLIETVYGADAVSSEDEYDNGYDTYDNYNDYNDYNDYNYNDYNNYNY